MRNLRLIIDGKPFIAEGELTLTPEDATPPVDQPPVEEPPVVEPPVVDEPPVEEPPITEPPVVEPPPVIEPPPTQPPPVEPPPTEPPVVEPPPPVVTPPTTPPPAGWAVIADLGDLAGDPAVAPVALGDFQASGTSGTVFGSNSLRVVKDPTGLLGGNVVEIDYNHPGGGSPDENRSFENRKPISVTFGERLRAEIEVLIPAQTPERTKDQRKLLYFKSRGVAGGFSSHVVVKWEGNDLSITLPNPGGKTKERVHGFAANVFTLGKPHKLVFEFQMNTKPYDGTQGDGRFTASVDGVQVIDLPNVVIMEGIGGTFPLTAFQFGFQWQSSPVDTTIAHSEKRYFKSVRLLKKTA